MSKTPLSRRAILAGSAATAAVLAAPALAQATREFRIGMITPPAHVWNQEATALNATLRELSNNRFGSVVFPSGQLGNEAAMVQQLQTGALDMAWITTAEISNRVEAFGALHAPFLVRNVAQAERLLKTPQVQALLEPLPGQIGAVGLAFGMTGMRQMLTRDATNTVADIRGKKVRIIPSAPIRDFFTIIGAAPTPMPLPAVYDALANGQIDALDMDFESVLNNKYNDLSRTMLVTNHHMFPMVGLISARVWASLAPADREIVRNASVRHLDRVKTRFVEEEDDKQRRLTGGAMQVRAVGADFFGDAVAQWDRMWGPKAPLLPELRRISATF